MLSTFCRRGDHSAPAADKASFVNRPLLINVGYRPHGPVEMRTDQALLLAGVDIAQARRRRWYEHVA